MAKNDNQPLSSPELLALVYDELRHLAAHYMRNEPAGHSLQATALVHEAYIKLIEQHRDAWQDRTHFFAMAAQAMRRVLVDHARARRASKRGGNYAKLPLEESLTVLPDQTRELVDLDEALERLEQIDPRQSRIVEMRFFAGLSLEQIAAVLNTSVRTVKRDWSVARAWLYGELEKKPKR